MQAFEKYLNLKIVPIIDKYWYFGLVVVALVFLFSNEQGILEHRLFIAGLILVMAIHIHFSHDSYLYYRLNNMARRLSQSQKEYTDLKMAKDFERDLQAAHISALEEQLDRRTKTPEQVKLGFYEAVYDYLEAKAESIQRSKPNTYDILTLAMLEVDKDITELEEKIKANS